MRDYVSYIYMESHIDMYCVWGTAASLAIHSRGNTRLPVGIPAHRVRGKAGGK